MEETKDIVLPPVIYGDDAPLPVNDKTKNYSGTGTSSGTYTGKSRVVKSISDFDAVTNGDVLLIPFSDVSWTPVLARAGDNSFRDRRNALTLFYHSQGDGSTWTCFRT